VNVKQRLKARRQRKAHARYLAEKEQQDALRGRDPLRDMRDVARGSGAAQQGMFGQD
jgi:hypothetical protein